MKPYAAARAFRDKRGIEAQVQQASAADFDMVMGKGISGASLLAVLATRIQPPQRIGRNFLALTVRLWGGMFYICVMSLIFHGTTFCHSASGARRCPIGSTWTRWRFERVGWGS